MIGMGTIINIVAVLLGCGIGLCIKGGLPERLRSTVMSAIGLSTFFIGITGALEGMMTANPDGSLSSQSIMMAILCLVIGGLIGEAVNIEARLESFGDWCRARLHAGCAASTFTEGFMTASLLFCVGAMAIVGSLEDGLGQGCTTLAAKSILDGVAAIIFASSLGIGVAFSILPLFIYQGGITLLASTLYPYLSDTLISQISFVGSILIFSLGFNLMFQKKIKVANLLPAMFLPVAFAGLKSLFPNLPI